jgi:flagellar protein FlgJ
MIPQDFVKQYYHFAKQAEEKTKVPALAIMAQAALESGWGKYNPGNMFFGIKAKNWYGKKQLITTTEYHNNPNVKYPQIISITKQPNGSYKYKVKDWFRAYDTPEGSFTDHANLFIRLKRYKQAMTVTYDPYLFVQEIAKAGYATDPNYADKLTMIINMIKKFI